MQNIAETRPTAGDIVHFRKSGEINTTVRS